MSRMYKNIVLDSVPANHIIAKNCRYRSNKWGVSNMMDTKLLLID